MAVEAAVQATMSHAEFNKRFRHPVKFDGSDYKEVKLSPEEQRKQLSELASKQLHVFLERYGDLLAKADLKALSALPGAETPEVQFWLSRLGQEPLSAAIKQKRARSRRLKWTEREEQRPDGFFCEEEMQKRQPMLWKSMIGRFMMDGVAAAPREGEMSGFLFNQLERDVETSAQQQMEIEQPVDDMEEDDDESSDCGNDLTSKRARFQTIMRDRFINGKERSDFIDYTKIDEDSDLDDLEVLGQDAEERYFDDDDVLSDDDDI